MTNSIQLNPYMFMFSIDAGNELKRFFILTSIIRITDLGIFRGSFQTV